MPELDDQPKINDTSPYCDELLHLTDEQAADRCLRHETRPADMYPCVIVMYSSGFCCFKVIVKAKQNLGHHMLLSQLFLMKKVFVPSQFGCFHLHAHKHACT